MKAQVVSVTLAISCLVFAATQRAQALPMHPHGDPWTAFERDGDRGGPVTAVHGHPAPGASEAGDESHQHYVAKEFKGGDRGSYEPWGVYGAWDNRSAFVDGDVPFTDKPEYTANKIGHGFIEEVAGKMPRYKFDFAAGTDAATKTSVTNGVTGAFDLWGGIKADVSPATAKPLVTGIGFEKVDTGASEIVVHWSDIDDGSGGGFVEGLAEGTYNSADPVDVFFDSSFAWDFVIDDALSDLAKWHFFSVALHEVGHLLFLLHSLAQDIDLMTPTVGAPLAAAVNSLSYRWSGYVEAANEVDDRFFGTKYTRLADGGNTPTAIADRESVEAVKSLYSIPLPSPTTLSIFAFGLAVAAVLRRRAVTTVAARAAQAT